MYCGSGWLTWEQLCDDSSAARRGGDLWERPSLDAGSGPKQQVVWREVLFRALLVHVVWDLKHEMQGGERMLIICFLRRLSEPVAVLLAAFLPEEDAKRVDLVDVVLLDSALGLTTDRVHVIYSSGSWAGTICCKGFRQTLTTLEDDWQLLSGWSRSHLASQVKIVGQIGSSKKTTSLATRQWIEFADERHALLRRGEVEPATAGSAHSAPCQWHMSSPHQTFTCGHCLEPRESTSKMQCGMHGSTKFQGASWTRWARLARKRRRSSHQPPQSQLGASAASFGINCRQSDGKRSLVGTNAHDTPIETRVGGSHRSRVADVCVATILTNVNDVI